MRRLAVEMAARAKVKETLLCQLNESPCSGVLRASGTLRSITGRESDATVVAAVVDGG
jgi:hypothetical protein